MKFSLEHKNKEGFTFNEQDNLNDSLHQELLLYEGKLKISSKRNRREAILEGQILLF